MNYLLRGHHHRVHERRYPYFSWYSRIGQSREIVDTSCPGLGSRKSQVTRLVGSPHSRSNQLLSTAVSSFASISLRGRGETRAICSSAFNVPGSGCRRSISPGTMVTRSVIRHACIRRFAVSTSVYICIC